MDDRGAPCAAPQWLIIQGRPAAALGAAFAFWLFPGSFTPEQQLHDIPWVDVRLGSWEARSLVPWAVRNAGVRCARAGA